MSILIEPDVWLKALAGGAMIGLAAAMILLFNGRIAGVSGIVGGLLTGRIDSDSLWRIAFVAGLAIGAFSFARIGHAPVLELSSLGWGGVIGGGLLVGFGTRIGSGCTSGHGVCGLARLSPRSLVATLTFMGFGFLTVLVIRHLWSLA
jgi:uncharacterized membrane protein YedE/YeeE